MEKYLSMILFRLIKFCCKILNEPVVALDNPAYGIAGNNMLI